MHGHEILLPEQQDGQGKIYHDTNGDDTTGIFGQI